VQGWGEITHLRGLVLDATTEICSPRRHYESSSPDLNLPPHTHKHTSRAPRLRGLLLFARADSWQRTNVSGPNLPPDVDPGAPPQEILGDAYQPHAYDSDDHTVLRRIRYSPDPAIWGTGPYPTVLTIHPGNFYAGEDYGVLTQRYANYDLVQAGFLVFAIDHRLAPDGLIQHQHVHDNTFLGIASGRPPQQSNDVKQQILAARADPDWDATKMPKAVVGLSGVYDLTLRDPMPSPPFLDTIHNYTNTTDNFIGFETQYSASPISYVYMATSQTAPARLYATDGDTVPWQQSYNMMQALQGKGVDVIEYTIQNSNLHAFNYWHTINSNTGICVSAEVIAFLNAHR
jgi:acetyl esterase/lipase